MQKATSLLKKPSMPLGVPQKKYPIEVFFSETFPWYEAYG
jgi:hypothetical protein